MRYSEDNQIFVKIFKGFFNFFFNELRVRFHAIIDDFLRNDYYQSAGLSYHTVKWPYHSRYLSKFKFWFNPNPIPNHNPYLCSYFILYSSPYTYPTINTLFLTNLTWPGSHAIFDDFLGHDFYHSTCFSYHSGKIALWFYPNLIHNPKPISKPNPNPFSNPIWKSTSSILTWMSNS